MTPACSFIEVTLSEEMPSAKRDLLYEETPSKGLLFLSSRCNRKAKMERMGTQSRFLREFHRVLAARNGKPSGVPSDVNLAYGLAVDS